jgi:aminoglycoside/choline kinase family phosphotransferase
MGSEIVRDSQIKQFLADAGWGDAVVNWLGQDASTRRYARLRRGHETALLMDAPPIESTICTPNMTEAERHAAGWNAQTRLAASRVDAFVLVAHHLESMGLTPPQVHAFQVEQGFALIEDFGEGREFARLIERGAADEQTLYRQAAMTLAQLHSAASPTSIALADLNWPILQFDSVALRANADLYADWLHIYDDRARMTDRDRARWEKVRDGLINQAEAFPREFTLRDYHAENLLYLPDGRIGLLDFQDAVLGWDAWDMAMLTQDARRHVSDDAAQAAIRTYLDASGKDEATFLERLAIIGTLNALRITGVFARLVTRDGKPRYNDFMPRQQLMLARNLAHPAAAEMAAFVRDTAPFIFEVQP